MGECYGQKKESDEQQLEGEPAVIQESTTSTGSTNDSKVSGTGLKTDDKMSSKLLVKPTGTSSSITGSKIGPSTDFLMKSGVGSQSEFQTQSSDMKKKWYTKELIQEQVGTIQSVEGREFIWVLSSTDSKVKNSVGCQLGSSLDSSFRLHYLKLPQVRSYLIWGSAPSKSP
jgi:hypothetical protein